MTAMMSIHEAAVLLNTDHRTIWDLVHTHELTPVNVRSQVVRAEIEFFATGEV